jgi:serine/threonine-protein kinase
MQIALTNCAIAAVSFISGPLIFVPLLAYGNAVSYISASNGRRVGIVLAGSAAVAIPLALEAFGVLSPSYYFSDGVMHLSPAMTELPEIPTLVCLLLACLILIIAGGVFFAHLRKNYLAAERKLQLYAWQLRQIVPEQARKLVE